MPVSSITLTPRRMEYSPLEEAIFDIGFSGEPAAGDGGIYVLQIKRAVETDPNDDPVLFTDEQSFPKDCKETSIALNLRDRKVRRSLVQTTENGKYVLRGLIADDYYATAHVKDTPAVTSGSPTASKFEIVPVSAYEFRTSYLPERVLYRARLSRTNISPLDIETETRRVVKNAYQDNELERVLKRAESYVSSKIDTAIRPTKIITRPDLDDRFRNLYAGQSFQIVPDGYDEIGEAMSYHRTDNRFYGANALPKLPLISVERVRAVFLNQVIYEFPNSWIAPGKYGNLFLIPVAGTDIVAFTNALLSYSTRYREAFVERHPKYWAVDWTYGHVGVEPEFDELLQLISYVAAKEVLTFLGSADKPGIASESRSTGGTSESLSYTQSAVYALFSADVDHIMKQLPTLIPSLRQRIHGPELIVV